MCGAHTCLIVCVCLYVSVFVCDCVSVNVYLCDCMIA